MPEATTYNTRDREDLLDIVTTLSPQETPLFASTRKGKRPGNVLTEWLTDSLDLPNIAGKIEGEDVTSHKNPFANRAVVKNRVQTFTESWKVSREQEIISGPTSVKANIADAKAKALNQLKVNMAAALGSDQQAVTAASGVATLTRGLGAWVSDTQSGSGTSDIPASVRTPSSSIVSTNELSETQFNGILQSVYEASGAKKNYTAYLGPTLKRIVTEWKRGLNAIKDDSLDVPVDGEVKTIVLAVEIYEGDFGVVKLVPDLFLGRANNTGLTSNSRYRGYVVTPELLELGFAEAPTAVDQPDQGGGKRGYFEAMMSIRCLHPAGFGKIVAAA
ncbi:MAG: DUF5309 domain-containing protein [Puniceicoccales bacterium]|jgi:hypothetical protein|nr:DUF5309 domain-containing protein [Puniceicoccales bacterium]